jgi:multiple sugar transport system substrate-binding protein/putative aldouronate transport system substrate-binding protein
MKIKRIAALTLCILIVSAGLAACDGGGGFGDYFPDEEGTVEITFFNWELGRFASDANERPLPVYDVMAELLDISIIPISAPWGSWEEALSIRMASGSIPDIFIHYGMDRPEQFSKWQKEELILPFPEDEERYPNLYRQLMRFDAFKPLMNGYFYGMPISNLQDEDVESFIDHALYIRKDWLTNLNLPMPTTLKELEETLLAFTFNDPNGNGRNDTYGFGNLNEGGAWWFYPYINMFDVDLFDWKNVDGEWVPDLVTQEMKDAIHWLWTMYRQGALDAEFATCSLDQLRERFLTGRIGVMAHAAGYPFWGTIWQQFQSTYPDRNPTDMFEIMPVMVGSTGKQRINGWPNSWCMISVSSLTSEKKRDKIFSLLDYMLSDEGLELLRYGIEGEHYRKNGDIYELLLPRYEDGAFRTLLDVDPSSEALKRMITWDKGFLPDGLVRNQELQMASARPFIEASVNPNTFFIPVKEEDFPSLKVTVLADYINTEIIKLICTPDGDFDQMWDNLLSGWRSRGGTEYIEAMNKSAKAIGK